MLYNYYEELCPLGIPAYAVRMALTNQPAGLYNSVVDRNNQQPNGNLLGFLPLGHRRDEAKNLALNSGITLQNVPSFPAKSAFNVDFLAAISNVLANTETFKLTSVVFNTLSEAGSLSQTLIETPVKLVPNQSCVRSYIRPTSLVKYSEAIFGSAIFYCHQLLKEDYSDQDHSPWAIFETVPDAWVENRNVRRNLPIQFNQEVFSALSQYGPTFRSNAVKQLVLTKR